MCESALVGCSSFFFGGMRFGGLDTSETLLFVSMLIWLGFFLPSPLYFPSFFVPPLPLISEATLVVLTEGEEKNRPLNGPERDVVWALCSEDMEPVATVGMPFETAPDALGTLDRDEDEERSSSCVEMEYECDNGRPCCWSCDVAAGAGVAQGSAGYADAEGANGTEAAGDECT